MKTGPETMRISRSSESLCVTENFMAARYQRLENPRIFSSSTATTLFPPRPRGARGARGPVRGRHAEAMTTADKGPV